MDNSFINLLRGGIIKGTVEDEPVADRQMATPASHVHGSFVIIVRIGDVFCCPVVIQPFAYVQLSLIAPSRHWMHPFTIIRISIMEFFPSPYFAGSETLTHKPRPHRAFFTCHKIVTLIGSKNS